MKNIEIIVDVTGSCNPKEIESQLKKIQDELKGKAINTNVSFWDDKEILSIDLQKLEIPFKNEKLKKPMGGGGNFTEVVRGKVKNNPDTIIFIGDFFEAPLQPSAFKECNDIQLIVIQTTYENKMDRSVAVNFVKDIKDIVDTKITDVETYKSLDDILKYSIQDKIEKLRKSTQSSTNNSEPKP